MGLRGEGVEGGSAVGGSGYPLLLAVHPDSTLTRGKGWR